MGASRIVIGCVRVLRYLHAPQRGGGIWARCRPRFLGHFSIYLSPSCLDFVLWNILPGKHPLNLLFILWPSDGYSDRWLLFAEGPLVAIPSAGVDRVTSAGGFFANFNSEFAFAILRPLFWCHSKWLYGGQVLQESNVPVITAACELRRLILAKGRETSFNTDLVILLINDFSVTRLYRTSRRYAC